MLTEQDLRAWNKREVEDRLSQAIAKLNSMEEVRDLNLRNPNDLPPLERDSKGHYKIVCPYCLSKYEVKDLLFHAAAVPNGMGEYTSSFEPEEDEEHVRHWKDMGTGCEAIRPHILDMDPAAGEIASIQFLSPNGIDRQDVPYDANARANMAQFQVMMVTDKYGNKSSDRICPECHTILPVDIGFVPNYIFTLMGNSYCGKTVYLRRLTLSLCTGRFMNGEYFGTVVNDEARSLGESAINEAQETFQPNVALAAATDIGFIRPVIIRLINKTTGRRIFVTLFDYPGEGIWKVDEKFFQGLAQKNRENANAWLMMFDAGTMSTIHRLLPEENRVYPDLNAASEEQKATPDRIWGQVVEKYCQGQRINKPIAFVLSKSDLILACQRKLSGIALDSDPTFLKAPPLHEKVDLEDLYRCDREIRNFLSGMDTGVVGNGDFFTNYNNAWFAFSATGSPLVDGCIPEEAIPHGLRDTSALEWMLYRCGEMEAENRNVSMDVVDWACLLQTGDRQYREKKMARMEMSQDVALLQRALSKGKFSGILRNGLFTGFKD
jgi:hypothetical protein